MEVKTLWKQQEYGCRIFHGPHISNFKEIYGNLQKKNLSYKITNQNHLTNLLKKNLIKKLFKKINQKFKTRGNKNFK